MRDPVGALRLTHLSSLATVALVALAGCGGGDFLSDYTLRLTPVTLDGQDPFASAPAVKLLIRHAEGGSEIHFLGEAKGGEVDQPSLGPLKAGTRVGVLLEEPGGDEAKYNPDLLVAYGEVTLAEDLELGGQEIEVPVLVPQFANVGVMGDLGANKRTFRPAAAMIPGGDVFLFGGATDLFPSSSEEPSTSKILRLSTPDLGDWTFQKVGDLPDTTTVDPGTQTSAADDIEETAPHRVGAAAAVVDDGGQALVLVTGGRRMYATSGVNIDQAILFDPVTESVVWGAKNNDPKMRVARSDHGAIVLQSGDVFLYGGFQGAQYGFEDLGEAYEIFDLSEREFLPTDGTRAAGDMGMAAASLGVDGVLVCGGATSAAADVWEPADGCDIVNLNGIVLSAPAMPVPVQLHAMAPLPDGRVLACGGVLDPVTSLDVEPATDRAWVYDGSSWEEVGPMKFARAHHVAIPTPTGEVVIVGGGPAGGPVLPDPGDPQPCTEIFDPATNEFTTVGASCSSAGAGAFPSWSAQPADGAFVFEGFEAFSSTVGGQVYGLLGYGPDLQ